MKLSLPVYVLMTMWSLIGGVFRIELLTRNGYPIDVLPIITLTLGSSALVALAVERRVHPPLYLLLAGWMPFGAALRIAWQISNGQTLDPLPAISVLLASTAFTMYAIAARQPLTRQGGDDR